MKEVRTNMTGRVAALIAAIAFAALVVFSHPFWYY